MLIREVLDRGQMAFLQRGRGRAHLPFLCTRRSHLRPLLPWAACRCSGPRLKGDCGFEHTLRSSPCGYVRLHVGVPPPPLFQCFFFLLEAGLFVLLILLECGSYHHPEEFITLSPSPLLRPGRLRNKSAIVGELPPEFRCAGELRCSRLSL